MLKRVGGHKSDLPDESLLMKFISNGDLEILGELYSRYMHLVYGVCLKYLKNREDSKDAVMQIFEKLVDEIPRHEIKLFRSWLYVLAKNYCLMHLRAQQTVDKQQTKWAIEQENFMESEPELHPIDKTEGLNDSALIECIKKLKEEQQKCIRLFYFENKCYQEIAESLNMEEKKVKSHLQNGKRNLKICLENRHEPKE